MLDLIIRNARVYDGVSAEPVLADVGVQAGKIAALGKLTQDASEVIDAQGLALMPGIIDNHTHYDAQVTWDRHVSPSPRLGVTTAVIGNCGFTIAPCRPGDRDLIMKNLTQVEGMSLDVLRTGIDWEFESIPEYLDYLHKSGCLINLAAFAGHSSIRTYVMGEDAATREATDAEIEQMHQLVVDALDAGAIGFATSTSPAHNGHGGRPMPSRLASDAEMQRLVGALGERSKGLFMLTKGGHTKIDFLEQLASQTGRPVVVAALLHNSTNPSAVFEDLDAIEAACQRGHKMAGAISPCPLTNDFTMHSPYPVEGLQAWQPALGLEGDALKRCLADPAFRQAVRDEVAAPTVFRLFNGEWEKVAVVQVALPENQSLEQRSIADIAAERGTDPLDTMLDLALQESLDTVFSAVLLNSDEEAVRRILEHPASLVSLSDAGAHLTFFNDAGYGLHLLGHWSRDLGAMSLGDAVRRLTSHPAEIYGIQARGRIETGYQADLLLFDPQTVGRSARYRVHDLPGGGSRLNCDPQGVRGVWVNGVRIVNDAGDAVEIDDQALPGGLLREFAR